MCCAACAARDHGGTSPTKTKLDTQRNKTLTRAQARSHMEHMCTRNAGRGARCRLLLLPPSPAVVATTSLECTGGRTTIRACDGAEHSRRGRSRTPSVRGNKKPWMKFLSFPAQARRLWPPAQACLAGMAGMPTRPFPSRYVEIKTSAGPAPPGAAPPLVFGDSQCYIYL